MTNENFTAESLDKYQQIAKKIEDALIEQGVQAQIRVGSTDLVNWNDIVTPDFVIFGVLNVTGGNTELVNGATIMTNFLSLALALPNSNSTDYSSALVAVDNAILSLQNASNQNQFTIDNMVSYLANQGRTGTSFLTIKGGKEIGVLTQQLIFSQYENLLLASDAVITIKPSSGNTAYELKGVYTHTFDRTKIIDSLIAQNQEEQLNLVQSKVYTLTIGFNKIADNTLHQLLLADDDYFVINLNDGQDQVFTDKNFILQKYTQTGTQGSFINCQANFISKG